MDDMEMDQGHDMLEGNHEEHMAALDLVDAADATHVAVNSGNWFDASTWADGTVPGDGARVHIPDGVAVEYAGESDASIFTIGVAGSLTFAPDIDSQLIVDTLVVAPSGTLEIGTEDNPVTADIDIIIANNGAIDTNWDPMLLSRGIVSLGDVSIHGEEVDSHSKVVDDPMAGDTSITLAEDPFGWKVGDTIVIAGTENGGHTDTRYDDLHRGHTGETRTITSIDGNTITFDEPLEFDHATPRDYFKTSVANYSRTVTISSEDGADSAVYERGHVMFMGSDDVDVRFAAFDELGRTDKSFLSEPASSVEDIAYDSNVQGRYSLHLHQLGVSDQDNPIIIEGNAVIGSPGWGIAQHSSHANIHNNATLDIWGASYVSEAGDETGTWTDNISIGNVGTESIERLHSDVAAGDLGRTGNGFWMQSRMIETIDNIAVAARTGFVWIVQGSVEDHDPDALNFPEATGYGEGDISNRQIAISQALNNEVFGSERGFTVTKGFPNQENDLRSIIDGFDAWNVRTGILSQYTAHYTFKNIELVAVDGSDPQAQPEFGIQFANNVSDMVIVEPIIDGFENAYDFSDFFSPSLEATEDQKQFFIIGGELTNIKSDVFVQEDWADRTTLIDPDDLSTTPFTISATATDVAPDDYRVYFEGTRDDTLGEFDLVLGTDTYLLKNNDLAYIAETEGYFTKDGAPIILVDAYYMDRVTGEVIKVAHQVGFEDPDAINRTPFAGSTNNGELPDDNPPPVAKDDYAETSERTPVTLDLLANDSDDVSFHVHVDGFVQPANGKVVDNGDGTATYTPNLGFTGTDFFEYWVTDGYGQFTKAVGFVTVFGDLDPDAPGNENNFIGDALNNHLIGNEIANKMYGLAGADTIEGEDGADVLYGGDGNDRLYDGAGDDFVYGGEGDDYVRAGGGKDAYDGGAGTDYISYYSSSGGITADLSADTITGSWANNDTIKNFESISGSKAGGDHITGTSGANTIRTYGGDDKVYAGAGSDTVELGDGNDYVRVGGGVESFDGGDGTDYISYYDSTGGITADLAANTITGSWANNDTIENFESISGSKTGGDHITGTSGANTIRTYGGDDKVYAGAGADTVELGDGNDYVRVGGGVESFDGGDGTDYISYYSSSGGIRIDLRDDEVSGSWANNDTIKDFESASGSKTGDDVMLGTSGANTLQGYGGDDKFYGRGGDDKLVGGDGEDYFDGGDGTDLLYGGADADVFHFDKGEGDDIIKDFENNIDVIELDNFGFTMAQAFSFADQQGSDVVFDFGADGHLTVENATIAELFNDLNIV